nr:helix-turn-helix domain-containing protein [Bacillus sp. T3]
MPVHEKDRLIKKLENHLRSTARHLIKFDTEEEVLQYLTSSFHAELYCDFVGVILSKDGKFVPKAWSENLTSVSDSFPIYINQCSPKLFSQSLTYENADPPDFCQLSKILKEANVKTWFTVPLNDANEQLGFCIVGFLNYIPLLDMEKHFEEFGKDVALAMRMVSQKKSQIKKIEGIEWISKNLSLNAPIEKHIAEVTSRAGKGTNADFACIYLFNEKDNCFVFQQPSYGNIEHPQKIIIKENYLLNYFPYLEKTGGRQLTIPLVIDLNTIGVLHIENEKDEVFSEDDLRMLELLSNHVVTIIENARLFNNEKEHKNRLQFFLEYQQALVKESVEVDNFDGITSMLANLFQNPIFLFDRFMRMIACDTLVEKIGKEAQERISSFAITEKNHVTNRDYFTIDDPNSLEVYTFWMIKGEGNAVGYLALRKPIEDLDEFDRLTIELARNVCSIQFIKQKLVFDAKEQAKDSFINKLLTEKIEDNNTIIQYANLFQWNLFQSHQLAVFSMILDESELKGINLFDQEKKKDLIWDYIKSNLKKDNPSILASYHDKKYILIVPENSEGSLSKKFWLTLFNKISSWAKETSIKSKLLMGVGGKTTTINDYFVSYQQAIQALNIVSSRLNHIGFSLFDELGSYAILHHLNHSIAVDLFVKKQLGPLLSYSEGKNTDLVNTLHTFLQNNGNVKSTAEELYIHRSSLLYRLEKIESLLEVQLSDAEVRFNLMMALKLYDMYGNEIEKNTIMHP